MFMFKKQHTVILETNNVGNKLLSSHEQNAFCIKAFKLNTTQVFIDLECTIKPMNLNV